MCVVLSHGADRNASFKLYLHCCRSPWYREGLTWLLTKTLIFPGNFTMVSDISKISSCFLGNCLSFIPYEPMWHDSSVNSKAAVTQLTGFLKGSWKAIPALSCFTGSVVDISQRAAKKNNKSPIIACMGNNSVYGDNEMQKWKPLSKAPLDVPKLCSLICDN